MNDINHISLSSYQLHSTLPAQSNKIPLFTALNNLLIYHDHNSSSASLNILDIRKYLEQSNKKRSFIKLQIPCTQFQGKIIHIEYSIYLKKFLIATGSKLFTLNISDNYKTYHIIEYFDIVQKNFSGILRKFICHPIISNEIYLLCTTFGQHTLIHIDLNNNFKVLNQFNYPKYDTLYDLRTTTNNHKTTINLELINVNDFVISKDMVIFGVTYRRG